MRKAMLLLGLAAWTLALGSCFGPIVPALGESDDMVIVSDPEVAAAAAALAAALETEVSFMPGEKTFRTTLTSAREMGDLRNRRHLVLLGTWEAGEVRNLARRRLAQVRPGTPAALTVENDIWADGQVVAAIMAPDEDQLLAFVAEHGDEIRYALEEAAVDRMMKTLCRRAGETGVTAMLSERYGWSLCLPPGYDLISTHEDSGFVLFRRTRPDRSIFLYWEETRGDPPTAELLMARREWLADKYYDGDETERLRPVEIETVRFAGREALRISAWWANRGRVGGGPFRSYCFDDGGTGKSFIVDVTLFAPGLEKTPLMRSLDAIARTFSMASE